jgi:hypothetical protein
MRFQNEYPGCGSCAFFYAEREEEGQCRRNAPFGLELVGEKWGGPYGTVWPLVATDAWCGEYRTNLRRSHAGVDSDVTRAGSTLADLMRHLIDAIDDLDKTVRDA